MTTLPQRIARFPAMVGWPGGIGIALLGAALILTVTLALPTRKENASMNEEIQRMKLQSQQPSQTHSATDVRQQLDTFAGTLPQADDINVTLNRLHELAAKHHLSLKNSEYRKTQNRTGGISQLQISVKTEGVYTDVRELLRELPKKLPALAISRLSLTRQKISDTKLDAVVEFTLFYSQINKHS
jgi:Type II secretion system (T2SS), protein M subtype b